jgi:hypothetical protein
MGRRRILYTLKNRDDEKQIRHLLLQSIDDARVRSLSEMVNGVETQIAEGTKYEMEQKAQEYITAGKYRIARDDEKVFEPLGNTVALAKACGFKTIYDGRYKKLPNALGEVPLDIWPGLTGKNGGGYEYAFDAMKILARPTLPPNHGLNMRPKTKEEYVEVMRKSIEILKTVGPAAEFILGGNDFD